MPDDPQAGERAALGSRCRQLLQSEPFQEAIAALHREYEAKVMGSDPHDSEKRDRLILEYHALKRIVARLKQWEDDGVMAATELDRINPTGEP